SHAVSFASDALIFRLDIDPRWLERLREGRARLDAATRFVAGRAPRLASRLYEEFRAADEFSALCVEGLALELLAEAGRTLARDSPGAPPRWLESARDLLHERFAEAPTITEIASAVGVHPSRLAHEFRRHYRASAGEYARRLRVEEACRALAATDAPLSAIAARAGFYDQSHFTNVFRRVKGTTPARYRALLRPPQTRPK
ncbi:MAG: AraC family transcriptional regulator, partial [Acidobacteriota bacterium]|nr:AraC family transcriptional regulator [Acidobacteriota bacterium]